MAENEIELKLHVAPEDLARLKTHPLLAGASASTRTLESTYFDTRDLQLHRNAVTLRVRRQGRRFVQTLKVGNGHAGLLFDRGEWEGPVPGAAPDLAALPAAASGCWPACVTGDDLVPLFTSHIKRRTFLLDGAASGEAAVVEAAVDAGEIRTPDGRVVPVSEIELELKQGDPRVLYEIASAIADAVPLRLETRTKSARGYALATGQKPAAVKAAPPAYTSDATAEQAFEAILRACLTQVVANQAGALAGDDPEGIHQFRVGLRRLRSALALFRDLIPAEQYAPLSAEVKWLAGELGEARDWDVLLGELVAPVAEALPEEGAIDALRRVAEEARREGYARARAAIESRRSAMLMLRLGAWVEGREWRRQSLSEHSARLFLPAVRLAAELLDRRHRRVRKEGKRLARLDPAERHRLRIALKKLRYACEFFRPLHGGRDAARYAKRLVRMQDALGHFNDVATAGRLLASLEARYAGAGGDWRRGAGMIVGWHARGLGEHEAQLREAWETFFNSGTFWRGPSE